MAWQNLISRVAERAGARLGETGWLLLPLETTCKPHPGRAQGPQQHPTPAAGLLPVGTPVQQIIHCLPLTKHLESVQLSQDWPRAWCACSHLGTWRKNSSNSLPKPLPMCTGTWLGLSGALTDLLSLPPANFSARPLTLTRVGFFHFLSFSCLEFLCSSKDLADFILLNTSAISQTEVLKILFAMSHLVTESVLKWIEGFSFRDWTAGDD